MMALSEAIWLMLSVVAMLWLPVRAVRAAMRNERDVRAWSARGGWRYGPMPGETFNGSDPL